MTSPGGSGVSWREFRERLREQEFARQQASSRRESDNRHRQVTANRPSTAKKPKGILRQSQQRPQPVQQQQQQPRPAIDVNDPRYKINPKKRFYHDEELPRDKEAGAPVLKAKGQQPRYSARLSRLDPRFLGRPASSTSRRGQSATGRRRSRPPLYPGVDPEAYARRVELERRNNQSRPRSGRISSAGFHGRRGGYSPTGQRYYYDGPYEQFEPRGDMTKIAQKKLPLPHYPAAGSTRYVDYGGSQPVRSAAANRSPPVQQFPSYHERRAPRPMYGTGTPRRVWTYDRPPTPPATPPPMIIDRPPPRPSRMYDRRPPQPPPPPPPPASYQVLRRGPPRVPYRLPPVRAPPPRRLPPPMPPQRRGPPPPPLPPQRPRSRQPSARSRPTSVRYNRRLPPPRRPPRVFSARPPPRQPRPPPPPPPPPPRRLRPPPPPPPPPPRPRPRPMPPPPPPPPPPRPRPRPMPPPPPRRPITPPMRRYYERPPTPPTPSPPPPPPVRIERTPSPRTVVYREVVEPPEIHRAETYVGPTPTEYVVERRVIRPPTKTRPRPKSKTANDRDIKTVILPTRVQRTPTPPETPVIERHVIVERTPTPSTVVVEESPEKTTTIVKHVNSGRRIVYDDVSDSTLSLNATNPQRTVTTTTTHLPKIPQTPETTTTRVIRRRIDGDDRSVSTASNSLSTVYLAERGTESRVDTTTPLSKPTIVRRTIQDDTISLPSIDEGFTRDGSRRRTFLTTGHEDWPIYKYSKDGGIACLLRVSPSALGEVKSSVKLVDGLPSEQQARMPKLPAMEFDADEEVVLSPMQLLWDNPRRKMPSSMMPMYVIMPVNSTLYNDALQQLMFLYTVDYKPWQIAEGRIVHIPIDGVQQLHADEEKNGIITVRKALRLLIVTEHEFYESIIHEPFNNVIFDIKARYIENSKMIQPDGGEVYSSMEPGVRAIIYRRTFDEPAKVKIRVEPLDMNEVELHRMISMMNLPNIVAVSPIIKVTASQPTKRPITVYVPKPGMSIYGSTLLGLRSKLSDLRGIKYRLYTKDRAISRYQHDTSIQREFANEIEFNARIWRAGGSCYAFIVMTGNEPRGSLTETSSNDYDDREFLTGSMFREMSADIEPDELKIRSLGRQLLNFNATNDIFRSIDGDTGVALVKILHRWKSSNKATDEGTMVRQLVKSLRECGFTKEAMVVQMRYRDFLTDQEGSRMLSVFDELKSCPAVMVNWRSLGLELGLSDVELRHIAVDSGGDLRGRCLAVLRRSYDIFKQDEQFNRDILQRYIEALEKVGCPNIAAAIERRHLDKFYMNAL